MLIEIENNVMRDSTMWLADIFAAKRNLKVMGRTIILTVSIIIKTDLIIEGLYQVKDDRLFFLINVQTFLVLILII